MNFSGKEKCCYITIKSNLELPSKRHETDIFLLRIFPSVFEQMNRCRVKERKKSDREGRKRERDLKKCSRRRVKDVKKLKISL